MKHAVLDYIIVKSERCQCELGEAMEYSSDEDYLIGLTQNAFSSESGFAELMILMTFWEANGATWTRGER